MGEPSAYTIGNSVEVQATQLDEDRSIVTPNGPIEGKAGDWEVVYPDGVVKRMSDDEWQKVQGKDEDKGKEVEASQEGSDEKSTTEETIGEKEAETETETPEKPSRPSSRKLDDRL